MFKPLHQDHAIESVILRLTGSGEMTEHERSILDEGYEKYWKAVLPTVNQAPVMEIAMGPMPLVEGRVKPLAPTHYVEFMRTGKAAWWMENRRADNHDRLCTVRGVEERKQESLRAVRQLGQDPWKHPPAGAYPQYGADLPGPARLGRR